MTIFKKYHYEDMIDAYQDHIYKKKIEDNSKNRKEFYFWKVHTLINHVNISNYQDIRDTISYFLG